MRLDSNDGEAWIELTVREFVSDHLPSVCFAVEISAYGWEAYDEEVWVAVPDLARFQSELEALDSARKGAASLQSMSPDEFILSINTVDRAGHIGLRARLKRVILPFGPSFDYEMAIAFLLDPASLVCMVGDLRSLPA